LLSKAPVGAGGHAVYTFRLSEPSIAMRCYARYLLLIVVAVLALGQFLAACGQKGPLYLPEESQKAEDAR